MGSTRPNPIHVGWVGPLWWVGLGWIFFNPLWRVGLKNPVNLTQPDPHTPLGSAIIWGPHLYEVEVTGSNLVFSFLWPTSRGSKISWGLRLMKWRLLVRISLPPSPWDQNKLIWKKSFLTSRIRIYHHPMFLFDVVKIIVVQDCLVLMNYDNLYLPESMLCIFHECSDQNEVLGGVIFNSWFQLYAENLHFPLGD